ncbi:MAG TPA: oligosaccharide flippase family protein, partial [Gaiellaceae bacterium]|nr:oligosaccharide flippase family protein [Gaiellaceae bacterium]
MLAQLKRLARHSAVYGIGGIVSRVVAVFLLPVYTRYLDPADLGAVGVLIALTAVLVTVLRGGISSAFFRFWFDSKEPEARRVVLRTSFWFTMTSATLGLAAGVLLAEPIAGALALGDDGPALVIAAFVGLWAQMNYEQLTALFRVEERSGAFLAASLANIAITVGATVLLVVVLELGALGVIAGNFTGTLAVYLALAGYRREQLGLEFDRALFRRMQRFGMPLVPSALALIAVNFSDRFFLAHLADLTEVGLYEIGVRIASAMVLLLTAFRTAWPAFAYSIEDEDEARRTYAYVLTYLVALASWVALALGLLAPWLVRLLTTPEFHAGERVVGPLAFASAVFAGYVVVAIGVGRARRTQFNWAITGAAAVLNVALNLLLIPPYGMMGAAVATIAAYALLFLAMAWWANRVFPMPYQVRRVATALGAGVALLAVGRLLDVPLWGALALAAAYPLVLLALGFAEPGERAALRR